MSFTKTAYEHIVFNQDGVPVLDGTTMKVIELVLETRAYGWSPEELHFQHPYLSLGQIHSALAYYWDHQLELDLDIEQRASKLNGLRGEQMPSPLVERLRSQKLV